MIESNKIHKMLKDCLVHNTHSVSSSYHFPHSSPSPQLDCVNRPSTKELSSCLPLSSPLHHFRLHPRPTARAGSPIWPLCLHTLFHLLDVPFFLFSIWLVFFPLLRLILRVTFQIPQSPLISTATLTLLNYLMPAPCASVTASISTVALWLFSWVCLGGFLTWL